MNKTSKIVLAILGGIVLLGGIGAWYATKAINPTQLASLISSSVKAATGRELRIEGPVSLSVFPKIAVTAERLGLSNASWGKVPDMLTIKHIELDIKTIPLLKGRVEIDRIGLNGVKVYLQTNASGMSNWELSDDGPTTISPASDKTAAADSSNNSFVSIEKLSLADTEIEYLNSFGQASHYEVRNLSVSKDGNKTMLSFAGAYGDQNFEFSGKTGLVTELLKDWGSSTVNFPIDLNLVVNKKTLAIKGAVRKDPKADAALDIALTSKSFDWPSLGSAASKNIAPSTFSSGSSGAYSQSKPVRNTSPYLFSNDVLPFNSLPKMSGKLRIDVAELGLPGRKPIENIKADVLLKGNAIDIPKLAFMVGKGSADLQLNMSKLDSVTPLVLLKGATKDFTLESLLGRLDPSSKVSGGNMKLALNLQLSGNSLHQMAANSSGKIQVSIEQAKMGTNFLNDAGDFVITLLDSMNPLRKKSTETVLECAVAYLPINHGQINIANSVGMETDRLNVVLAGSINLKNEVVNLTIDPKEKSGLTTGLDLAGLVKVGGTLSNPKAMVNQAGVVNSAVSIGLGFLTGGASLLAENARSLSSKSRPCREALHPWSDIYAGAN